MAAKLPDLETLWKAGINPKNGLPTKFGSSKCTIKEDIKKYLRLIDEQDAVNRYTWFNLPCDLTSQELERLLYYKGQLCFFYFKELDKLNQQMMNQVIAHKYYYKIIYGFTVVIIPIISS